MASTEKKNSEEAAPAPARDRPRRAPSHDARELTRGGDTAELVLDGKPYMLRITRAGKLILTK
nr:hemin uptake protein HemP [Pontibaca methylaminivorans]